MINSLAKLLGVLCKVLKDLCSDLCPVSAIVLLDFEFQLSHCAISVEI